ncbi:ricin-type beta-trefoil lectin domain protein, partial [Streptomyces lasiicapitis]|uniref:ricin-type beta-trefoil lectin domain protein n=1 Tax=Streptomyces lasiicapitis TaxID=1923961 RepID=UPI0036BEEB2E
PRRFRAAGARRRRFPVVGALALALIAGLLQALWLPAQPASAAVSDHRAATWNMNGKPKNVSRLPGLLEKYNLDVLALQEVPNTSKNDTLPDEDGQGVSPIDHTVPNYKPDGTKDSPEETWRVQEFRLKRGVHLYYITTNKNNRGIGFATKEAVENVSTDMRRLKVRGLQTAPRGKKKTPAFPSLGVKIDDDWFYSLHATTETKRGENNVELALQDFNSFQNSPVGSQSWAVMGDFNRFPSENSGAFKRAHNELRLTQKSAFPGKQRAVEQSVDLGAMSARAIYSGDRTQKKGAELDFMVARGAANDFKATRLNSMYGSDHHPVVFTSGPAPDPCDTAQTARKSNAATARRATAADDSCSLPPDLPRATVSMGDSFISGEGGRWQGNANTSAKGSWGTDRGAGGPQLDVKIENGSDFCHRSDVAEIKGADIDGVPKERRFNIACSGARTQHVIDQAQGDGNAQGNTPQIEQLAEIAEEHYVTTIALSIGGNDLEFSKLVTDCGWDFIKGKGPCNETASRKVDRDLEQVRANVVRTIEAIRDTMTESGQDQSSYQLVVQSYPAPLPASGEMKYSDTGVDYSRYTQGGCPFYDADVDWTRKGAVDSIGTMLRGAAEESEASFLDLRDAFDGHELCAKSTQQASSENTLDKPVPAEDAEWVRFHQGLTTPGETQEVLHPNAYGQKALSACLTKFAVATGGDTSPWSYACRGEKGRKPGDVDVSGDPAIDAAVRTADNGPPNQYLFRGNQYTRFEEAADEPLGEVKDISSEWPSLRGTPFVDGFDAAFEAKKYDKRQLILFRGDQYVRVEIDMGGRDDTLAKGPLPITTGFKIFEGTPFAKGVDAAMEIGDSRMMLFKGDQMAIFKLDIDGNGDKWVMEPRAISEGLPLLKGTGFENGIDTAMQRTAFDPEPNGSIVYLVDGRQALRLYLDEDLAKSEIELGPMPLTELWPSLKGSIFDETPQSPRSVRIFSWLHNQGVGDSVGRQAVLQRHGPNSEYVSTGSDDADTGRWYITGDLKPGQTLETTIRNRTGKYLQADGGRSWQWASVTDTPRVWKIEQAPDGLSSRITTDDGKWCLAYEPGSTTWGSLRPCNTSAFELWKIEYAAVKVNPRPQPIDRTGPLQSAKDDLVADVDNANPEPGTRVKALASQDGPAQKWRARATPKGWQIISALDGAPVLAHDTDKHEARLANDNDGDKNQLWQAEDAGDGWTRLRNGGLCLTAAGAGETLAVKDCASGDAGQRWKALGVAPEKPKERSGEIVGLSGKCLDVKSGSADNGTPVQIWDCNGSDAQKWTLPGDGTVRALGKCLDVASSGTANGTLTQLWNCNGSGA